MKNGGVGLERAGAVRKWCTNQMQPTIETLYEIAEALDVDVRELLVSTK